MTSDMKDKKLAKRTVQIFGFGFTIVLTATKLIAELNGTPLGIDWWVIFMFFGFGAGADVKELIEWIRK